ncbi:MAG: right-handed parallel beta-helix repeat-containing protein [Lentisphaeraceae bacterium]|nr:right-handed parallel beta-helix repeat-containing protein [Lentisphaeraceae bacterium]
MYVTVLIFALMCGSGFSADFYVSKKGVDQADQSGTAMDASFASLAYAVSRLPEGKNTIHIAPGEYTINKSITLTNDLTIKGSGARGEFATILKADDKWSLKPNFHKNNPTNEYLLVFEKMKGLEISHLSFQSKPEHRITGALYCMRSKEINVHNVDVREFRWGGVHFEKSSNVKVSNSTLHNCSVEKSSWWGGNIRSRYLSDSEIFNNTITSDTGGGYGYKASGHTNVRVHHNYIKMNKGFSIESAHEHEYGLEIDHNHLIGCVSVPKPNQSADPSKRGHKYSVWIHHNYLEDSYTIEGPRNHMRVSHNYINVTKTNGRIYTHHGGINKGPIWIHNNIINNVDRSVVWMNRGYAANIHFYNNTVFTANAGERAGALFGAWEAKRLDNWTVQNNIFIAPIDQPRSFMAQGRGVPTKIKSENNICVNINNVPEGNITGVEPKFSMKGLKPWEYYKPTSESLNLIDKGIKVELPFNGDAIDIGAIELGAKLPVWDIPAAPVSK